MDLDLLVGALTAGSLYALVAMGFNILYRPTNVFNFAQGDLVMLGAMFGATFITLLGLPWFVGAALAMLAVAALALVE
jgi:branched-chain amino acid transport system permease protein